MKNRKKRSTARRGLEKARRQTHGNTGRKKLAGPAAGARRGPKGRKTHPPAKLKELQQQLGKRIRGLREQNELDTVQLAKECGVPTAKIENLERGEVNVTLVIIIRLAYRFGLSVADFLRGIE